MPIEPGQDHAGPVLAPAPQYRWYHKTSAVVFIAFCFEIGLFLLIFPWTEYWDLNYFAAFVPEWNRYWQNMYVRGAISGLGVVNLYITFVEIFRLRRFARR
jgi:hypothetical protein